MTFILENSRSGKTREFETRGEAEDQRQQMIGLGVDPADLEIRHAENPRSDGGPDVDVVDHTESEQPDTPDTDDLDAVADKDLGTDPISVMPQHFVDSIQGVPTINRKGYAVLAEHFGVSVVAEPVTLPSDTDFEYAEFRAVATTEDGTEYSGFGSAHVDRMDGDDPHLLAELAETRAMKRATAWATGVGVTAMSEMQNTL